jgi:hypothetical protein
MCLKLQYALNNASYGKMVIHQNGLWRGIRLCSAIFASENRMGGLEGGHFSQGWPPEPWMN